MAGTATPLPTATGGAGNCLRNTIQGGLVVTLASWAAVISAPCYPAALRAGGPVICVTAGGVDVPYYTSDSSRRLLADVSAMGTLVSLMPPGTPHLGTLFGKRNRLLTGLTVGTVCVEAGARSGTLQVARLAIDQSRDVYAVPANVGVASAAGTNDLLRQGLAIPGAAGQPCAGPLPAFVPAENCKSPPEERPAHRHKTAETPPGPR